MANGKNYYSYRWAMIQLLKVNEDGTGTVNLFGLRRVVIRPDNSIFDELVPESKADDLVREFNQCFPSRRFWAESLDYTAVANAGSS